MNGPTKLHIDRVSKRYWFEREAREIPALVDISLSVGDGEFVAVVGPSGCGKTSLMNIVAGLLNHDEGTVTIDGKKVTVFDGLSWKTSNIQHPMFQTPLGDGGLEVNVES